MPPATSADDLLACLRVLQAIQADRGLLVQLDTGRRRELLMLAGQVAKPDRHELRQMARAFRRAERQAGLSQDREALDRAGLRAQRRSERYAPLWLPPPALEADAVPGLNNARACYVCKQPFTDVHRYYDSMCRDCGDFNYARREHTADLNGRVALVTGARVKIGYQAALKLLRAGARVVALTRFPVDAAARYATEPDYGHWCNRLQIHGLDLRHTPSVEIFSRWLAAELPRLDYVLNNACQTVRRPAGFFRHLLERESGGAATLPAPQRAPLAQHESLCRALVAPDARTLPEGLLHSAELSQRRYLDEDFLEGEELFPLDRFDEDGQQVDQRDVNSWRLRLHEVQTPELLEVHLVNAIAPYILNARLKPLMMKSGARDLHIVNVSAMEGQFYRTTKTDKHPHTNMAKAALNMMTRTSAPDYVRDGIHMNAVDTGWVTDEDPQIHAARKAEEGFAPPLDIIDGAARIVDPVFSSVNTGTHVWGQFLKDYRPAPW
jgi:NAD(P)-dependent dehydrogenase (short-subunit alcohol dehydrogenase family)